MAGGPALSFVLLERPEYPDPDALVEAAAELGLTVQPSDSPDDGPACYEIAGGGALMIMLIDAPHPDAQQMAPGLASPEPEDLEQMTAHYIVTALGLADDPRVADPLMASLTAAVVRSSPSIAAMLGHGISFHKAAFFTEIVGAANGELPMLICIDITMAPEPKERMSFLTHGLDRYGREEFYITASQQGKGALDFLLSLAAWMLDDPDKDLPTGDTVGRTAEEKVLIQRVPSPLGDGPDVIRLDLDS